MTHRGTRRLETRTRILNIAAAEMRSRGPNSVGVADVMNRAGLTHGGFYAHFRCKDALIAAALSEMFTQKEAMFHRLTADKPPDVGLGDYIDSYLSEAHRDHPENGCPIAALSPELARLDPEIRQVFDSGVTTLLDLIEPLLAPRHAHDRRALVVSLVAEMAGALALSRAILDQRTSAYVLSVARRTVRSRVGLPAPGQRGEKQA